MLPAGSAAHAAAQAQSDPTKIPFRAARCAELRTAGPLRIRAASATTPTRLRASGERFDAQLPGEASRVRFIGPGPKG